MTHPAYTASDRANWTLIPPHMIGGLRRYIENGIKPGSFLCAVLRNDLCEAVLRADDVNRRALWQFVAFLYDYAPIPAWGSPEKFDAWIKQRGLGWTEVYDDGPMRIVSLDG